MYATAWSLVTHHRINHIDSMQPRFDFQAAADTILNSGEVLVTDAEALVQIDPAPERDILIDGDLQQGTAFQSQQSLVVNGSIRGLENNTCRIEARQDLLIAGDACHAHLEGRNIHIGGGSKASELRAQEQISLGADMVATKLKVGNGGMLQRRCEDLRRRLVRHESSKQRCDRQRTQDEKILDRTCQLTSLPLDLNLGKLIRHGDGRVQIDLESVYRSLEDASEKHLRAALNEFFAKGIMGALARTNRKYIVNNPTRARVFTQFIGIGGIHLTGVRRDPHQCSAADRHGRFAPGRSRLVGCPRRLGGSGGSFPGRRLAMRSWKRIGSWATASSSTR